MAILTTADQPNFFPTVLQSGGALQALCALAQSYCEGHHGANRPLEQTIVTEVCPVRSINEGIARLSLFPVTNLTVEARILTADGFDRILPGEWHPLTPDRYRFEAVTGEVTVLSMLASQVKATYSAGYNFASATHPDVNQIKAIAGAVLVHLANNYYGALDSYLSNPTGQEVVSSNYAALDSYLKALLNPLRRYLPYTTGGVWNVVPVDIEVGVVP